MMHYLQVDFDSALKWAETNVPMDGWENAFLNCMNK